MAFHVIYYWFDIVEYITYFFVLNFTKYSAYNFIIDVNNIYELNQNDKKFLNLLEICNIAGYIVKISVTVVSCKIDTMGLTESTCHLSDSIVHSVPILGMDVIAVVQIVLVYYMECCARKLKELLITNDVDFEYVEKFYIDIANCHDKIKPLYGRLVSFY